MFFQGASSQPQGGFIFPQDQFQAGLSGPVLQPGIDPYAGMRFDQLPSMGLPTFAPMGWDFTSPGVGEQFFHQQQGRYMMPTSSQQFLDALGGQYYGQRGQAEDYWGGVQGGFGGPTRSEEFADTFGQQDPGLDPYYARARERALGDMNQQLAARGGYGSSAGVDMLGQVSADLAAEQANREADYRLQEAGLGGHLAAQADQQRLAQLGLGGHLAGQAQGMGLQRMGQAGQLAGQVDSANLAQLGQGMQAALQSQDARRMRGRDYQSDLFQPAAMMGGLHQQAMNALLAGDDQMFQSLINMQLGLGREGLNQDYRNQEQHRADIGMIMKILGSAMGGGGGGMMGG